MGDLEGMAVNRTAGLLKMAGLIEDQIGPRTPVKRRDAGRVLRYWTTDAFAFMGKNTTTAPGSTDWGVADGRTLRVVAARLRSLRSEKADATLD